MQFFLRKALVAVRLLCLVSLACASVAGQYRFVSWTIDEGLPQNSINAIVQTREGYLWMTTMDGLVRFDGVSFKVFDRSNTPTLRSNRFLCLYADSEGALWAGTDGGGLVRYRDGAFHTFTTAEGLPHDRVREVRAAADAPVGTLLVHTEKGFATLRAGVFTRVDDPLWAHQSDAVQSPEGTHWRWANAEAQRLLKTHYPTAFQPQTEKSYTRELYGHSAVGSLLLADRHGNQWGTLRPGEIFQLRAGRLTHIAVKDAPVRDVQLATRYAASYLQQTRLPHRFTCAAAAPDGTLWLGTMTGLLQYRDGQALRFTTAHGLTDNDIQSLLIDREGTLWIGTAKGLTRGTRQFISGVTLADGLPRQEVYPLLEDQRGDVWLGTDRLSRWSNGHITNFDWHGFRRFAHAYALHEDAQGRLWVSGPNGLGWFKDGSFTDFPRARFRPFGADNDDFTCYDIHQDRLGQMWFVTNFGLFCWSGEQLTAYTKAQGLPGNDIRLIHEDNEHRLWVGTQRGVARLDGERFTTFGAGAPEARITAMHNDGGALWIGTYDSGLYLWNREGFAHLTQADGLFNNEIFQILEDDAGYFWLSSNKGIARVSKRMLYEKMHDRERTTLSFVAYGKQDGMPSTECNAGRQPAGFKSRDGRLWFPTQAGAAIIDPHALPHNALAPPVQLEQAVSRQRALPLGATLTLQPEQDNLELHYTGLSFIKPEQVRFRYRLAGWDSGWIDANARRTAYYSHLAPGDYTFQVQAANSDGVWNDKGATLRITVVPPFYRTWWWYALVALTLLGGMTLAYRARIAQVQRSLAQQEAFARQLIEAQERERQRIAAELHDSLGQNLQVIKNRALLGVTQSDVTVAQTQFRELNELAATAIEEVRHIAHDLRPPNLARLGLASTLEEMLEEVAEASGINISVTIDALEGLFTPADELNLFRIVQEAVNNLVKHAQASQASVTIVREGNGLQITIRDNGCGFAPEASNHKPGVGLTSLAERVQMLGGTHQFESAAGQGTSITIQLPL